ncbi:hypothetical protein ASD66_22780 [Nocardioides sp. Root151]|nr:hypothetical protein ASD30_17700 [Nocardioides sp. Root140]KQZ66363.1 hypothetical protein ASD66_22780 [Nocardioides sp. Root151]KRF19564.1 hypothetical protein ASH02_23660 [Nocardioides sp. Soil796]
MVGALGLAGSANAAPAAAATTITNYAFQGWAYGTYANVGLAGVSSSPTAYSWLGCTRRTGIIRDRSVAAANVPNPSPVLKVGAVASRSRTYKSGRTVGMRSTNRVASVRLGAADGLNLSITGLSTTADAHARSGRFGTSASFSSVDIAANTGTPLDDILNQVGAGVGDLIKQLQKATGNELTLPGLGVIRLGKTRKAAYAHHAFANAVALNVTLFGLDGHAGGSDDVNVTIGRSFAQISDDVPSAVMAGNARVLEAKVLGGVVTAGPISERSIPCEGTRGVVRKSATVGANLLNLNAVVAGVAQARVYGVQQSRGRAKAWTEAALADIKLGVGDSSLQVKGVVARANVARSAKGRIAKSTAGSSVASITFGGKAYKVPVPGQTLDIGGLVKIQSMVKSTTKTGITVTALRVTVLGDQTVVVNIGVAKASLRRT